MKRYTSLIMALMLLALPIGTYKGFYTPISNQSWYKNMNSNIQNIKIPSINIIIR